MSQYWIFFNLGLKHILDIYTYDHILFLIILAIPFIIKDWKYLLLQITIFTVAHTFGLLLVATNVVKVNPVAVNAFIPISLLVSATFNFYKAGKSNKKGNNWVFLMTILYGVIHGLGFLESYNTLLKQVTASKMMSLLQFTLGLEVGQLLVVLVVFLVAYIAERGLKFSRRELMLISSAFVIGFVLPMILKDKIWLQ
jgi:hypothetical protein